MMRTPTRRFVRPRFMLMSRQPSFVKIDSPAPSLTPLKLGDVQDPSSSDLVEHQFIVKQVSQASHKNNPLLQEGDQLEQAYYQCGDQLQLLNTVAIPKAISSKIQDKSCSLAGSTPWPGVWITVDKHLFLFKIDSNVELPNCAWDGEKEWLGWHDGLWMAQFSQPISAVAWSKHGRKTYCAVAFPFQIRLYEWDGLSLTDLHIPTTLNRQQVQKMMFDKQNRLLYAGDTGWLRQANSLTISNRFNDSIPLKSKVKDCLRSLYPFEYTIKNMDISPQGRGFLIVKNKRKWFSRLRQILIYSHNLSYQATISTTQLKEYVCLSNRFFQSNTVSCFQPKQIIAESDNRLIVYTKSGLRLNILIEPDFSISLRVHTPPPLTRCQARYERAVPHRCIQLHMLYSKMVSIGISGIDSLAFSKNEGLVWWDGSRFEHCFFQSDYAKVIALQVNDSPLDLEVCRFWVVVERDTMHLYSRKRLADSLHDIFRFGEHTMHKEHEANDYNEIFTIYGNIRTSSALVQILSQPDFKTLQTQQTIQKYTQLYDIKKIYRHQKPYAKLLDQTRKKVLMYLRQLSHKQHPISQLLMQKGDRYHAYSVKTYGYFHYLAQVIHPLLKEELFQAGRLELVREKLDGLKMTIECENEEVKVVQRWDQNQVHNHYLVRSDKAVKQEQRMDIQASGKPQPRSISEKKIIVKLLPRFIDKVMELVSFTEDAKALGFSAHGVYMARLWCDAGCRKDFVAMCLKQAVGNQGFQDLIQRCLNRGILSQLFNRPSIELSRTMKILDDLFLQYQRHNSQDYTVLGRIQQSLTGSIFYLDERSWDQRLAECVTTLKNNVTHLQDIKELEEKMMRINQERRLDEIMRLRKECLGNREERLRKELNRSSSGGVKQLARMQREHLESTHQSLRQQQSYITNYQNSSKLLPPQTLYKK